MKLHLPSGLRKALMACLAALALPSLSVSTTIASASGIAAAFAALSAISASQAWAEQEYTWSDVDGEHTDTFSGTVFKDDATTITTLNNLDLTNTDTEESLHGSAAFNNFWDGNANSALANTLYLKRQDETATQVNITADWSGSFHLGGLIVDGGAEGEDDCTYWVGRASGTKPSIIFKAEDAQDVKLYIGSNTTLDSKGITVNSNSDWKIAKGKTLRFTGNADSVFTIGDGVSVNLSSYGTAEGGASVSIEMGLTMTGNSTLTVGDGVSLAFAGGNSTLTSLDLTTGGQVTLSHGKLTVQGQLNTDDSHRLEITYNADGGPQLSLVAPAFGTGSDLYLTLTGFTDEVVGESGYTLFADTWEEAWKDHIHLSLPEGSNLELDSSGRLIISGTEPSPPASGGWPADSEFGSETFTAADGLSVSQSGTVTYGGGLSGTVTLQGGNGDNAINVKITGTSSEINTGTLSLSGHIGKLMFTDGQFRYEGGWTIAEGTTIDDIYVRDAMLFFKTNTNLDANLHLGGRATGNSYEGALRVNSQNADSPCTVTLSGSLVIEEDTLITVQYGSVFKLTGGVTTGTGGSSHNLLIGSYDDDANPMGDAHVEFLGGGALEGTLGFSNNNGATPYLVLGKSQTLTVYGLDSSAGGRIVSGGEGGGYANLTLNGSESYTYDGTFTTGGSGEVDLVKRGGGTQNFTTSDPIILHTLSVEEGMLTVSGKLGTSDEDGNPGITVAGGTLKVGYIRGTGNGHTKVVVVGSTAEDGAAKAGTLEIGTEGVDWQLSDNDTDILRAKALLAQAGSTVKIHGDVNLYSSYNGKSIILTDSGTTVTIDGDLRGHNGGLGANVSIASGGRLEVKGDYTGSNNHGVSVDGANSNLTVGGTYTTGQVEAHAGGSVNISGDLVVTGGVNLDGGDTSLTVNGVYRGATDSTTQGGAIQLANGAHAEISSGLYSSQVTISGENSGLSLGGTVSVGTLRLEGGVLSLGTETAALASDLTVSFSQRGGAKLSVGAGGAGENRTITLDITLDDLDVETFTENRYHIWEGEKAEGVTVTLGEELSIGRGGLSYDSQSGDLVLSGAGSENLTWEASGSALVWQDGEAGTKDWENSDETKTDDQFHKFYNGDSVTFTGDGSAKTVTLGSNVRAWDMAVNSDGWTFDTAGHSLTVSHELTLGDGAGVVFQGTGSLQVASANVGNSTVTFKDSTISHYGPSTFYNAADATGKVVLDFGGSVTVDGNNNLFAALFAAGDANVLRDADHPGIGMVEVASGTLLDFTDKSIGKSLSLVRNLSVKGGGAIKLSINIFDNADAGYASVTGGNLTLEGDGSAAGAQGAIEASGTCWVKWDIELSGDATIYANTGSNYYFTGGATLNANGHTLTLAGEGTFRVGENGGSASYEAIGSGTLALKETTLIFAASLGRNESNPGNTFSGYFVDFGEGGSTLQVKSNTTLKALYGTGTLSGSDANATLTLACDAPEGDGNYNSTNGYVFVSNINDSNLNLKKTGTAIQTLRGSVTARTITVDSNGQLVIEGPLTTSGSGDTVTGGNLTVHGNLQVNSDGGTFTVKGGANVTVDGNFDGGDNPGNANTYFGRGHAGALVVGNEDAETKDTNPTTVTVGTEGGAAELLQVRQLTVYKNGKLTVHGNLSSSYGAAGTIQGLVEVDNDMVSVGDVTLSGEDASLTVNGAYKGASGSEARGGEITLSDGAHASMLGGLHSRQVTISGSASELTVGGKVDVGAFAGSDGVVKVAEAGAEFVVGESGLRLDLTLVTDGNQLTKSGAGTLTISKYTGWATGAQDGSIAVQGGTLNITGLVEAENNKLANDVTVAVGEAPTEATQNANAVFSVEGGDYTVGTVHFTGGSAADAEVTANGTVRVASGSSLTIDQLDLSGGNGSLAGADSSLDTNGTLIVKAFSNGAGSETHGLRVGWKDTALALTLGDGAGNDLVFAGGLYLANRSQVTLTEDMRLGWLGGDNSQSLTGNWDGVGGTISSEEARTLTLTDTTEHVGGNYTIHENITLKLDAGAKQTFTGSELSGSINLGEGSVLAFRANGEDVNTVTGQLSGSGTLQVQGGSGGTALQWAGTTNGYTGTLSFAGADGGVLELRQGLEVGNLETLSNGTITGAGQTLKLNYTGTESSSGATDHALTLGEGVTLEKTGAGTYQLQNVTGGTILVTEGTLVANAQNGGWNVDEIVVEAGGKLSAATENLVNGPITLHGGGALSMEGLAGNSGRIAFGPVTVTGGTANIEFGEKTGTITITELTGDADLNLNNAEDPARHVVEVSKLRDYTGDITGALSINGEIAMQEGMEGGCHRVVVNNGATLQKTGTGSFAIGELELNGTLQMVKEGEMTIGHLTGLGPDAALGYSKGYMDNGDGLLRLELGEIIGLLGDEGVLGLDVDVQSIGEEACNAGFCLGIYDGEKADGEDVELVEHFGFVGSNAGKDFDLIWENHLLYLAMDFRVENTEYDANWGIAANDENHRGPSVEWMDEHVGVFTALGGPLEQLLELEGVTEFTGQVLSLAGTGTTAGIDVEKNAFHENRGKITGIRLTKGDDAAETYLSVVGGSVFRGGETPAKETRNSFIVLKADDATANHFHLLVGGSSCVSTTAPESPDTFVGFNGNTHLQVEGGTVDYIIGGNHVTNTFFGFQQKDAGTFISVYDGNGGGVKSEVRGGIVGGSVITWSDAESNYHDFEGDTHIFIYTLLGNPEGGEAPRISDGTSEGASAFAAVVGGNVWIDVPTEKVGDNIAHTFNGATNIFVNLLDGKAIEGDTTLDDNNGDGLNAAGKFEKAIVGGNYTVPKEIGGGAGERKSVFQGVAGGDGDDTHITIYATEDHTFTAGINGASRRDAAGSGTTEFVGDTYVELHGGNYADIVAGGMWYQAPGAGQTSTHVGSFEGNTKVELFDGNYFRVAGGNVSLEGGSGSKDTFTGASTVIIHGGTFGMPGGEAEKQTDIAFVAGGSFYRSTEGSATHGAMSNEDYLTQLQIVGGTFNDVHLVGGDYINTTGVNTQERSEGPKIDGNTQVVIGSGEEGAAQPEITGVVVGGSYLTDDGEGGSAIITGNTNVEINGGSINAEVTPGGTMHAHSGVAVVAGSMLIDDGTTAGGHTVQIGGDTNLTINGGDITGLVVGGSYTSDSAGVNTIDMQGAVNMQLKGGTITGNIIGGHYSDNTENPDQFTLGDVTINVAGSTVHGLIFGGSFRRAEKGSVDPSGVQQHPQQGAITVKLTGGTVAGGVYAAGNHYNTAPDAQLHVHTARTEVEVTGDMEFTQFSGMTAGGEQVNYEQFMLSGGYQRNVTARQNLEDYSTVGYTEGANPGQYGTWAEAAAQLHFSDKGGDDTFANITRFAENLRLQDFDAVNVDEGLKVDLSGTVMRVMHKVAGTGLPEEATNHDSFIKQGKGDLVLKGLRSWNAQKYDASTGFVGTEEAYEGLTVVEDGHLVLRDSGGTQSLVGGLGYDVRNMLATGKSGEAFLRAEGGLKLSFAGMSGQKVTLQLRGASASDGYLDAGLYRLADGIDWSTFEGLSDSETIDPSELKDHFNVVDGSGNSLDDLFKDIATSGDPKATGMQRHFSLEREEGGDALVLRVMIYSYDSWVWWGDDGGTWKNDSTSNWSRVDDATLTGDAVAKNDVYFFDGVLTDGQVTIDGAVTPHNVYVSGGSYTFAEKTPGSLQPTGSIIIGEEKNPGYDEDEVRSTLELDIDGSKLKGIFVHTGGRLSVANEEALKGADAKVTLNGGTLMYAERDGALRIQSDLSDKLTDDSAALRVQVGNSALAGDIVEKAEARRVPNEEGMTATWSGKISEKTGIRLGVTSGIIQSGRGVFHFVWDTDGGQETNGGTWGGTLRSREGKLVAEVTNGGSVAIGTNGDAQLLAENGDAELQLVASNGTELTVGGGMSGSGTVTIGADKLAEGATEGRYTLNAEKSIMQNNFTGTLRLLGDGKTSTVQVTRVDALGHDKSTLALAGRALTFTDAVETAAVNVGAIVVEDNTTNMLGGYSADTTSDLNKSITLKVGKVSGGGVLANAQGGFNNTITGDLSEFSGTLVAGLAPAAEPVPADASGEEGTEVLASSWTLELAKGSTVSARLAGTGTINFTLTDTPEEALEDAPIGKVRLNGAVGDEELGNSLVLVNDMEGTALVLAGTGSSSTGKLVFHDNEIWLGDDDGTAGNWEGKDYEGTGTFVLKSGTLGGPLTTRNGIVLKVNTATAKEGSIINVNGTSGSVLREIVINQNGHLTGVSGPITVGSGSDQTKVTFVFTEKNQGAGIGESTEYLVQSSGNLVINDANEDSFTMDFSNEALLDILKEHRNEDVATYLHLISGAKISFIPENQEEVLKEMLRSGAYAGLLDGSGFKLGVDGGDLVLYGSSTSVYLVLNETSDPGQNQTDPHTISDTKAAANLSSKKATLVDEDTTLSLDLDGAGDVTINNLVGLTGSSVSATGKGTVELRNQKIADPLEQDGWLEGAVPDQKEHLSQLQGQDTRFDGKLTGEEGATFRKTGQGTLTVGDGTEKGGLNIAGDLQLRNGDLVVKGKDSHIGSLVFDYGRELNDGEQLESKEGLVVQGGKLTVGGIEEKTSGAEASRNWITLKEQSEIVYSGKGKLESTTIASDGTGLLTVGEKSSLALAGGDDQIQSVGVNLQEQSTLDIGTSKQTVNELNGTGTLKGGAGSSLTVRGGSFSGTLAGSGDEGASSAGKLAVANGVTFTLNNAKSATPSGGNAWDVQLGDDSKLKVDVSKGGDLLALGNVNLGNGSMEVEFGNQPMKNGLVQAHIAGRGTGLLSFHTAGEMQNGPTFTGFTVSDGLQNHIDDFIHFSFEGAGTLLKDYNVWVDGNRLMVTTTDVQENRLERAMPNAGKNGLAGATMMWDSLKNKSQDESFSEALLNPESAYAQLTNALIGMFKQKNGAELERTLTSVAGASIATLAPAFMEDIHRQLKTIRNRTTTMASEVPADSRNDLPLWHAWISGEGGYHKLDADGYLPGFTLNSWGGTVGVDIDVSQAATLGLALSAMYGDLKTDSADSATGDLDTTYLSAFFRASSGAWVHTFVVSGGRADIGLDRTVSYGSGSYRTKGSTDGYALGALYEVGYTGFVNGDGTFALQPVFNVEARHASIKGYAESDSDAGLSTGKMSQDIVTLGAGARMQSVVGGRVLNRTSVFEARALVKADLGDRSGVADNAIIGSGTRAEVESAEVGAVGVEIGAGITIPLGTQYGSIFMDASLEWRQGWTSADASVGYRISF